jgi:uncharacterized protein YecE (DUF72 family)
VLLTGTSGWSYQEWVGIFYPNNKVAKLPFYAKFFDSVEVDSSFYKVPSKQMIAGWIANTPQNFKFSLKVPRLITHDKKLVKVERELAEFITVIKPIANSGKLGCLLIQLPPTFTFKHISNLESFFANLPLDYQFAVEFRHESWDQHQTWELLKKYNISNTITDSPMKVFSSVFTTSLSHCYVRWHGRGSSIWYNYTYSKDQLDEWLKKLSELLKKVPIIYAYFNNHFNSAAPVNAFQMLDATSIINDNQKELMKKMEKKLTSQVKITDY